MNLNLIPQEKLDSLNEELVQIRQLLERLGNPSQSESLLTNKEAAKYLSVTIRTLQKYRDSGQLGYSQIGRKIYYSKADLEAFVFDRFRVEDFNRKRGVLCNY